MGLHTADPVTGEFSLGASGFFYRNGEFEHAVRGVTVAGRLSDLLTGVAMIGDDLTWFGSTGAPSLLVTGLTVAGA
jgi:PmbA protein